MRRLLLGLLLGASVVPATAQERESERQRVIDVRSARPLAGNSFEALWSAYRKADQAGNTDDAARILGEIRRLRVERNVRSLDTVALALVARGLDRVRKGELDRAEEEFRTARAVDPHLPDAHYGLALAAARRGILGLPAVARNTVAGLLARVGTARGAFLLRVVFAPVALVALFVTVTALSVALVLRHGTLLVHDLEEAFGRRPGPFAIAVAAALFLLPVVAFQGYGWLPLFWLVLLFIYFNPTERVVAGALLALAVGVGPGVKSLEAAVRMEVNPLYRASLYALELGPDDRAILDLENATRANPDDRDLVYLLGAQYKKAGRYDDAASLYRDLLRDSPQDAYALNNLGNLEFARGEFPAAIARYRQAAENAPDNRARATCFYNVSLAHLQRFEYQPAQEARLRAVALAPGLIEDHDRLWRYERGDFGVVDLGLDADQIRAKFAGLPQGLREKNLAGKSVREPGLLELLSTDSRHRFTGFLLLGAALFLGVRAWRGTKSYTTRCPKCGTPFCSRCHLGVAHGGLCTQCHHLFVVRDGVSGPARNQKLREVQLEEDRQGRVFRALSLLAPGAGHAYLQRPVVGAILAGIWSVTLAFLLLGGRVLPVSGVASALATRWHWVVGGIVLLGLYLAANRRPDTTVMVPIGRPMPQRQAS